MKSLKYTSLKLRLVISQSLLLKYNSSTPIGLGARIIRMTSSNGNSFRVTGPFCGEFTAQKPVTRSFDVFLDLRLNKRLSQQSKRRRLRRHCANYDVTIMNNCIHVKQSRNYSFMI